MYLIASQRYISLAIMLAIFGGIELRLIGNPAPAPTSTASATTTDSSVSANPEEQRYCLEFVRKRLPFYKELLTWLPKQNQNSSSNEPIFAVLRLQEDQCHLALSYQLIVEALAKHRQRIGIILPYTKDPRTLISQDVIAAAQEFTQDNRLNLNRISIFKNSRNSYRVFHQKLAELIFEHQVSLLIGGQMPEERKLLETWSERLQIPSLILSQDSDPNSVFDQSFYLAPSREDFAEQMARAASESNAKRIVVLYPNVRVNPLAKTLLRSLRETPATSYGIGYNPRDYQSMETVARELFHIDDPSRNEELEALVEEKKVAAEELGLPFDPRTVMLPPVIDIDAVFILDNFRVVRHFVKIFKYFGVNDLKIFGNQQWRAPELVSPPEEALTGANFFDFIGSYERLPYGMKAPIFASEFFTVPSMVQSIDRKIIARHAFQIAKKVLTDNQTARHELHHSIRNLEAIDSDFFGTGPVFNAAQSSRWPTFVFQLGQGFIQLRDIRMSQHRTQSKAASPRKTPVPFQSSESHNALSRPVTDAAEAPAL